MQKSKPNTEAQIQASVSSIYSELLKKRKAEREEKEEKKRIRKEEKALEKEEEKKEKKDETKMTKKERREAEIDSWKSVIVGLTGDDLDYIDEKPKKKKYKKWIDDEDANKIEVKKPKKVKKKNYQKEFEAEINMLKALAADQNKFTNDLMKRFNNMAGPATKDAMPLNKTLVDFAGIINNSRSNSLGLYKEIGALKKVVADLYMKQKDQELKAGGKTGIEDTTDLGLLGSNIAASSIINRDIPSDGSLVNDSTVQEFAKAASDIGNVIMAQASLYNGEQGLQQATAFDPSTWDGGDVQTNDAVTIEQIPHHFVVEWHKDKGMSRFKAVRDDTGEELPDCPDKPTSDPSKLTFNEKDLTVKGEFDEIYKLEIV